MLMFEKVRIGGEEFVMRTKRIRQKELTPDCWSVQVWGLPYCSGFGDYEKMCEYLGTEDCGGQQIRKKILAGEYPMNGLPDAGE